MTTNLAVFADQVRAGLGAGDVDDDAGDTAAIDGIGCFLGHFYARVTVEGTVLYCCNTEVVVGSLQTLPFSQWWRSARWEHWRQRMREGRYLASCFQCGKVNQNEALSKRFKARFGDAAFAAATQAPPRARRERTPGAAPPRTKHMLRVLP
jgi:hypothetical protein